MSTTARDVTICSLCNRHFTDPRYLICLHTFCKDCIKTNAQNTLTSKLDTYVCPSCHRPTPLSGNMGKWEDALPVNDVILALTTALKVQGGDVSCVPCSRKGKSSKASEWCDGCRESLCDECVEVHGTLQSSMNHEIMKLSDIRTRPLKQVVAPPRCGKHDNQRLNMYCKDHDRTVCASCVADDHRTCEKVSKIEDTIKEKQKDIRELKGALEKHKKNTDLVRQERRDALVTFDNMNKNTREKIQSVRKRLNEVLLKFETRSLREADGVYQQENSDLDKKIQEADHLFEEGEHALVVIDTVTRDGSDVHVLQWLGRYDEETRRIGQDVGKMNEATNRSSIDFKVNQELENIIKSVTSLGDLMVNKDRERETFIKPIKSITTFRSPEVPAPQQANITFNVRTPSDGDNCWITGIASLTSGLWVLADKQNAKLKLYDENFKMKSELFMDQAPFDVTVVDGSQVAVSIPSDCRIQIYDVKTGIDPVKAISVNANCYGISFTHDKFIVTCPLSMPPSVRIVSLDGQELTNISPSESFIPLFLRPWYAKFHHDGSNFFVTDANKNHVSLINRSVFRKFKYMDFNLTGPRGITLAENGEFYVCGWGSDNVQKVSSDGKFLKEVVNRHSGIVSPQNVSLSLDNKQLLVTLDPTSCNSDNILVFDI